MKINFSNTNDNTNDNINTNNYSDTNRYWYEPIGYGFEELRDLKLDEQPILIVVNYFFYSEFLRVW